MYDVLESHRSKIASMRLVSNAARELPWAELCKLVCDKFDKDQHNHLLKGSFCALGKLIFYLNI